MKRLLAFFMLLFGVSFLQPLATEKIFDNNKISLACIVSKEEVQANYQNKIVNGNQFLYYFDSGYKEEYKKFTKTDGIVLYFQNTTLQELKDFYKINLFQGGNAGGCEVYYGYTPFYQASQKINNKKVNVQIAISQDSIIVGFPMILTGF